MKINGFQKLTLLDFPGRVACIVFTPGCNFRCPFCHNASLVTHIEGTEISEEEIFAYLKKRKGLLDGVCITGGEPLLQPDLADFIREVRALGYGVKLDTNGTQPDRLISLIEEGLLDYVAMDVKNAPQKYARTAGVGEPDLAAVRESIAYLLQRHVEYEFRTTVEASLHTPQDIGEIGRMIAGAERYFLQNFVDSGDIIVSGLAPVDSQMLAEMLSAARKWVPNAQIRSSK